MKKVVTSIMMLMISTNALAQGQASVVQSPSGAAGLLFVTGKSAVIPRGRELVAYTITPEPFPVPAR
jgi:hypothetical protein